MIDLSAGRAGGRSRPSAFRVAAGGLPFSLHITPNPDPSTPNSPDPVPGPPPVTDPSPVEVPQPIEIPPLAPPPITDPPATSPMG